MGCGASAAYKLTEDQQLRLETNQGVQMVRGPQAVYTSKWNPPLKEEVQAMIKLDADEYAVIRDTRPDKTNLRTEQGEKRFFLEAHEEFVAKEKATTLSATEFCYVSNGEGRRRLVKGPTRVFPNANEIIEEKQTALQLSETEYCYINNGQGKMHMVKGPTRVFPEPHESIESKQNAIQLDSNMYVKLQHKVTGVVRVERGLQLVFPEPTDEVIGGPSKAVEVDAVTAVLVRDINVGALRLVQDHGLFFPRPQDEIVRVNKEKDMVKLAANDYAIIRDTDKNELRTEEGEQRFFLQVHEELVRHSEAICLSQTEYCYVDDTQTGLQRLVKGPSRFIPGAYETVSTRAAAVILDSSMYIKMQHKTTGEVWIERGPQLIFPEPSVQMKTKAGQKAVQVDSETAVLVRDLQKGGLRLVEEHGLFFPSPHDEILSVEKLIRLANYEAVVLKDDKGSFQYFYGSDELRGDRPRAFFKPPYWELVEHCWSRGRRRQTRDLRLVHLDMRPQFMNFEFNSRTSDNVELVLEGTFYWQLEDIQKMMSYSGDVTGDICNYARSSFIQRISQVSLKTFMDQFRTIASGVVKDDTSFYTSRGLKVHSLEVTGYHCADTSTAQILQQMIQETTNRMNRTSQQESENELNMNRIHGEIEQERAKGELLSIRQARQEDEARAAGCSDAQRALQFLKTLEEAVPDSNERIAMWKVLRKGENLETLAGGNAHLYFTPSDVNLSIEDRGR
jgi:hypothetical protein